jgi:two-component sensor histidine kinase
MSGSSPRTGLRLKRRSLIEQNQGLDRLRRVAGEASGRKTTIDLIADPILRSAICRRLVDVMGGKITVESAPHRGTTFSVHLPASCVVERSEK